MKRVWLILALIFALPQIVLGQDEPSRAQLTIGVYYVFLPTSTFVQQIDGASGKVVVTDDTELLKVSIIDLIKETETRINGYFTRKIINFELVFIKRLEMPEPTTNATKIFEYLAALQKPEAKLYLVLLNSKLFRFGEDTERAGGFTNRVGGNQIALAEYLTIKPAYKQSLMLHELGHMLGLNDVPKKNCQVDVVNIMCVNAPNKNGIIIDQPFLQSFLDFYEKNKVE